MNHDHPFPRLLLQVKNGGLTDFVGGASDGNYTVAAMDYVECKNCGDGTSAKEPVTARKSWFFFDSGR